jgi:hypothetical protein
MIGAPTAALATVDRRHLRHAPHLAMRCGSRASVLIVDQIDMRGQSALSSSAAITLHGAGVRR